jgi:hypothetical protein
MSINTGNIQSFSDQDILNALRMALVNSAFAKETSFGGRTLAAHSPLELQSLIRDYEWRVSRQTNGMFVVAENRPPE